MTTQLQTSTGEPEQFELQAILDQMHKGSTPLLNLEKTLYLVKWKGYSDLHNTWQPRSHLANVPEKLREWSKSKQTRKTKQHTAKKASNETSVDSDLKKNRHKRNKHIQISPKKAPFKSKNFIKADERTKQRQKSVAKGRNLRPQQPPKLYTPINSKSGLIKTSMKTGKLAKKMLLNIKKDVKKTLQVYERAQKYLQRNIIYLETTQDKSYDTDIVRSSDRSRTNSNQSSSRTKSKRQSSIFQRQDKLLKSLSARSIILEKTDVNEDQDLIIIEQSDSELEQYEGSEHQDHQDPQPISNEVVKQVEIPQEQGKQTSQKLVNTQKHENVSNELFDFSYQQEGEDLILHQNELQSVTPLPNITECYDGDNLNLFFEQPAQGLIIQEHLDCSAIRQILKMYKQEGIVYCQISNRDESILEKVSFTKLQEKRPDLICSFFNQQFSLNDQPEHSN